MKMAQEEADILAKFKTLKKTNRKLGEKPLGENVAMIIKSKANGNTVTNFWYDEVKEHNFKNHSHQLVSENFTQLVWKGTKEVGFGLAKGSQGEILTVAYYYPAGNTKGDFEKNVLPAK